MNPLRPHYDFVVIGAGVVGLSVGLELQKRYPRQTILILEKEDTLGCHASGRNSGVLHSGIYYTPRTLKAKVCSRGARMMKEFATQHHIPCKEVGKIIIPTNSEELPALDTLFHNATQNDVKVERLTADEIKKIEPYSNPYQEGIYVPGTSVIDVKGTLEIMSRLLRDKGATVHFGGEVIDIMSREKTVKLKDNNVGYGFLFNCAGAYADVWAHRMGLGQDYVLIPFKGIYYQLSPERSFLVKGNIYPVPNLLLPFLGVHFTKVVTGDVYVGPTAIPCLGRENYHGVAGVRVNEMLPVFWELLKLYLKDDHHFRGLVWSEMRKYQKSWYVECARKLLPSINSHDLIATDKVGIRPQLVNVRSKKLELDFILESTEDSLHVLNAISPAFTSALAFSELVVDRAFEKRQVG